MRMEENDGIVPEKQKKPKKYGISGLLNAIGGFFSVVLVNLLYEYEFRIDILREYDMLIFLFLFLIFLILFLNAFRLAALALEEGETRIAILTVIVCVVDFLFFFLPLIQFA